jgi:hypothetical protein
MKALVLLIGAIVCLECVVFSATDRRDTAVGVTVADMDASKIRALTLGQANFCINWDADMGGCDASYLVDYCPEYFDIYDSDSCIFCEWWNYKATGTRECSGGNEPVAEDGYCYEEIRSATELEICLNPPGGPG